MNDSIDEMTAFHNRIDEIQEQVDEAIRQRYANKDGFKLKLQTGERLDMVIYSASHDEPDSDLPINNLSEIAAYGTFVVVRGHSDFWDGMGTGVLGDPGNEKRGKHYRSEPVTNPTWLQLAVLANESIHVTNNYHHIFFEGISIQDDEITMHFGS